MNDLQVGLVIRAVRIRRGLRQVDVAIAAGVSQAMVSQVERGGLEDASLRLVRRVALTVGVSLPLEPRWRGAELAKLLDERHADLVRELVARLGACGWEALPEHTFAIAGERGSIDVLAWLPRLRALVVVEVKSEISDMQDTLATFDRKRRLAPAIARALGWRPLFIGAVLALPDDTRSRNVIARHAPVFDRACPARGLEVRRWLREPDRDLRGIWFLLINARGNPKRHRGGSLRVRLRRASRLRPDSCSETRPTVVTKPSGRAPVRRTPT
jgi:transcriptional regulator with XRE-family HTH domain